MLISIEQPKNRKGQTMKPNIDESEYITRSELADVLESMADQFASWPVSTSTVPKFMRAIVSRLRQPMTKTVVIPATDFDHQPFICPECSQVRPNNTPGACRTCDAAFRRVANQMASLRQPTASPTHQPRNVDDKATRSNLKTEDEIRAEISRLSTYLPAYEPWKGEHHNTTVKHKRQTLIAKIWTLKWALGEAESADVAVENSADYRFNCQSSGTVNVRIRANAEEDS